MIHCKMQKIICKSQMIYCKAQMTTCQRQMLYQTTQDKFLHAQKIKPMVHAMGFTFFLYLVCKISPSFFYAAYPNRTALPGKPRPLFIQSKKRRTESTYNLRLLADKEFAAKLFFHRFDNARIFGNAAGHHKCLI